MALAESQQKPWHHRPAIIVALLAVLPPVGIVLMWLRLPWTHRAKLAVTGIAGAWLVVILALGKMRPGSEAQTSAANATVTKEAPPVPRPETPAAETGKSRPRQLLIETDPLLLIPTKLDGFALASGSPLPAKVATGAVGSYYGENKHLVAHVDVNKTALKPSASEEQGKPIKIGERDAHMVENIGGKTLSIEWLTAGWHGLITVDYEKTRRPRRGSTGRESDRSAGRCIARPLLDRHTAQRGRATSATRRDRPSHRR